MRLIMGDLHLLNEANDRYHKTISNIQDALTKFQLEKSIDGVEIIGDVLDCEWVTFKRISYFSVIMELIAETFSDNIRILIGNHDKYFKNDEHGENIIRFIKFECDIVDAPIVRDRIL